MGGAWESTASGWGLGTRLVLKGWSLHMHRINAAKTGHLDPVY